MSVIRLRIAYHKMPIGFRWALLILKTPVILDFSNPTGV